MISWACGRRSIGNPAPQVVVVLPATGDLRGQRTGRPRVHDIGIGHETARLAALVLGIRRAPGRPDRPATATRPGEYLGVVGLPSASTAYHRDRHPEEPLPGDQPVAVEALDPRLVPHLHVGRMPVEFSATGDQRRPQVLVAAAVADVPLPRGDDLQRLVALSKNFTGCVICLTSPTRSPDSRSISAIRSLAVNMVARRRLSYAARPVSGDPVGHTRDDPAVPADDRARVQLQLATT